MNDVLDMLASFIDENLNLKQLCNFEYATVDSINPLAIKFASNKILSIDFLEFTPKTQYLAKTDNELDVGLKLLVVKKQGGQQYIIIDVYDVTLGTTLSIVTSVEPLKIKLKNGKILEDTTKMIFADNIKDIRTPNVDNINKMLITQRDDDGNYIFLAKKEVEE